MDEESQERQLNIHLDPEQMAGVYANFANVTFSPYEFTLTFARIDQSAASDGCRGRDAPSPAGSDPRDRLARTP